MKKNVNKNNIYDLLFIISLLITIFNIVKSKQSPKLFLSLKEENLSKQYINLINYIESNGGYVNPKLIPNEISNSNRYITNKRKNKKR